MEFTQPLGVGLGLAVRINNKYSHPVCTGRHTGAYTTINATQKYHGNTGYLLGNVDAGVQEFEGTGYHVDDMQMTQTDKSQIMMSCGSCTSQSHKRIPQTDRTKQDDIMSRNGNDEREGWFT